MKPHPMTAIPTSHFWKHKARALCRPLKASLRGRSCVTFKGSRNKRKRLAAPAAKPAAVQPIIRFLLRGNSFRANRFVKRRLEEFLGCTRERLATALYIADCDTSRFRRQNLRKPEELDWFLQRDSDIARSLGDANSLLLHLDVEYVNFDIPDQAFREPQKAFELQQPVITAIETLLFGWGIKPLHLLTGQGHHFVWCIPRASNLAGSLAALSPAPELLQACILRAPKEIYCAPDKEAQRAFFGIALLMEFLAHRVLALSVRHSSLPVEITAVHVGPGSTGMREIISVDISEYGDPLHTRMIRMPFTRYRKLCAQNLPLWAIPMDGITVLQGLDIRTNETAVLSLAQKSKTVIPEQSAGTQRLLDDYMVSSLRRFHQEFYSVNHDPQCHWNETYGKTNLEFMPHCIRRLLTDPNDFLLKPAGMQMVTRSLLAEGWHPRHIAGLIRSKLEDSSFGWGVDWNDYEPGTRADFYVRLFAGLQATGLDGLVDMNCVSTAEKGFCFKFPGVCPGLEGGRNHLSKP